MNIQKRLAAAAQNQRSYRPNEAIVGRLKHVTFGALIGPTGVGKSHLIPFVITRGGSAFSDVGNISSRAKRGSDPDNFRGGQLIEELLDRIDRRELVSYMVHPSGNIYATDASSYLTEYVLLPTLTSSLEQLRTMGCFGRIVPIGIAVDSTSWEKRLGDRSNDPTIEIRMREALDCISWLKERAHQIPVLENATGEEQATAEHIADIMQDPTHPHALENLARIDVLLSELTATAFRQLQKVRGSSV